MIIVNKRGRHFTLDNKDAKCVHVTQSERDEIEQLANKAIEKLSSEEIHCYRNFINPD
jgi:hypothetical protein